MARTIVGNKNADRSRKRKAKNGSPAESRGEAAQSASPEDRKRAPDAGHGGIHADTTATPASLIDRGDTLDCSLHAAMASFTGGLSPAALAMVYFDWATHLAFAPGKRWALLEEATSNGFESLRYAARCVASGFRSEEHTSELKSLM